MTKIFSLSLQSYSVTQAILKSHDPPASVSWLLGLSECATMPGKGVIISISVQYRDCCCRKAWSLPHSPWKHTCWRSPESESRTQASMRIFWKEHLKHYSNGYGCLRRLDSILFCPFFFFLTGSLLYSLDWHRICANPPASASLVLVQMCPILSS